MEALRVRQQRTFAFERISDVTAATITSDEVSALKRPIFEYLNLD